MRQGKAQGAIVSACFMRVSGWREREKKGISSERAPRCNKLIK